MQTPPKSFLNALKRLDPNLFLRWGNALGQWVIEQKSFVPVSEIGFLNKRRERARLSAEREADPQKRAIKRSFWAGIEEEFLSAREGRRVVLFTRILDNRIFDALCLADMQRYGGYSRMADEMERKEVAEEKEQNRLGVNQRESMHKEVYSIINFLERKRLTKLEQGERRLSELLK